MSDFTELKAGDTVFVSTWIYSRVSWYRRYTVGRVTRTLVELSDGTRWRRKDGRRVGGDRGTALHLDSKEMRDRHAAQVAASGVHDQAHRIVIDVYKLVELGPERCEELLGLYRRIAAVLREGEET